MVAHSAAGSAKAATAHSSGGRTGGQACVACRRKKIKCDAKKPVCSPCVVAGLTCEFSDVRKTGLPKGYVKSLQESVALLRKENEELRGRLRSNCVANDLDSIDCANHEGDKSISVFPHNNVSPAFSKSGTEILMRDPYDTALAALADLLSPQERDVLQFLYFKFCHPYIPIIHRPTFQATDENIHLILSMFALACRHDEALSAHAEVLYGLAKQSTQATLLCPSIETAQCLLMQVIYEIGYPNTALTAVSTLGAAIALVNAFRLMNIDTDTFRQPVQWVQKPANWVVEESYRRTALMTFALDQWLTTITERASGMAPISEVKLVLPVSDEIWFAMGPERPRTSYMMAVEANRESGPFARFVQVLGIFGMVNRYRHQYLARNGLGPEGVELRRIDDRLQRFLQAFPDQGEKLFDLDGEHLLEPTVIALAHTSGLLLHNFTCKDKAPELAQFSRQRSSNHAEDILDIASAIQDRPTLGNYMLPHCLIIAARVRLFELREQRGHYRGRDMNLLIKCLLTCGRHWGLQDKLSAHAACIRDGDMLFSEPLTVFEPTVKHGRKPMRQQSVTVIYNGEPLSVAPAQVVSGPSDSSNLLPQCLDMSHSNNIMMADHYENSLNDPQGDFGHQGNWLELIQIFDGSLDTA